jgi:hypothetical protein
MKRKSILALAVLVGLIVLSLTAKQQQSSSQNTIPFDPALTLSVVVEGEFTGFEAGQAHLTLIPTVTVYAPDETYQVLEAELPSDEWVQRVIQHFNPSQLPEGWIFFAPISDLTLHFVVGDENARLEKVVIKDWEGQILGEFLASPDRKQVSGNLTYDPEKELLVLEIWGVGSSSQLLARGVSQTPEGNDGIVYDTQFGFYPNPEDPKSKNVLAEDKVPLTTSYTYRAKYPDNDSRDAIPERPSEKSFNELTTMVLINDTTDVSKAPPLLREELRKKIDEKKKNMQSNDLALAHAIIPPFSREIEATWKFSVKGYGYAWIVIPYRGTTIRRLVVEKELGIKVSGKTPPPPNTNAVSLEWVAGIKLTEKEKEQWQIKDPVAIGDLWGISVLSPPIYPRVSAKSILQEVTVQIQRDKICGPVAGGSVTVEKSKEGKEKEDRFQGVLPDVGYYKDPVTGDIKREPPPYDPPAPNKILLDQTGFGKGLFPKGFRYILKEPALTAFYQAPIFPTIYEITPTEQIIDVPPTTNVTFDAKLRNVAMLRVYVATSKPDFLASAVVYLYKRRPDGSFPDTPDRIAETQRVQENGKEYEVAIIPNVMLDKQADGTFMAVYRVEVSLLISIPHTPYKGLWELHPTCEERRSVTIQLQEGQGPGQGEPGEPGEPGESE